MCVLTAGQNNNQRLLDAARSLRVCSVPDTVRYPLSAESALFGNTSGDDKIVNEGENHLLLK